MTPDAVDPIERWTAKRRRACLTNALVFFKPAKKFTAAVEILLTGCLFLYSPIVLAGEVGQEACPDNTVPFYRLRIESVTKASWTRLQIENPENILTARAKTFDGTPGGYDVRADKVVMWQPLSAVKDGRSVGITVDYALAAEAVHRPLSLHLQTGSMHESQVRVYALVGNTAHLIKEIIHHVEVGGQSIDDPLRFSLDLSQTDMALSCGTAQPMARERLLWAFYYPWYTVEDWSSASLRDHPIEPYESGDPKVIVEHIESARRAGIDGFISSWWGPDSYSDRNLPLLLGLAKERAFRVSLYFETLADSQGRALSSEKIFDWLAYAIATYRDHPAMMKINGKPLIVIWASAEVPLETWKRIFAKLRTEGLDAVYLAMGYGLQNLEVFDGVHDYGIFESTISELTKIYQLNSRAARSYQLLADASTPKISVATVQPGYDERSIQGRKGAFRDREGGAYYQGTFEAALSSDPDWIFITTWNEWWEHTHIEASQLNGARYLQITNEYARKWKRQ